MIPALKNFFWVSLEGTDAVGKSTVIKELKGKLPQKYPRLKIITIEEFSDSPIGMLIKNVIKKRYFFRLSDKEHLPMAETLLLAADFVCQIETILSADKKNSRILLITDRGPYSFLTYQEKRLMAKYPGVNWSAWISRLFSPIKNPDLSILLVADPDILKKRIWSRGEKITPKDMKFVFDIQRKYISLFRRKKKHFIIDNKNRSLRLLVDNVGNMIMKNFGK